jgi:hypothetical protein
MIAGKITLEDTVIDFMIFYNVVGHKVPSEARYTVKDMPSGKMETRIVPAHKFLKALAIAVHMEGMPDYAKDYDDAESIMNEDKDLRWIP